jgi:hypothetical protein
VRAMFKHEDFQFGYEIALGSAYRGYAEVGQVLATAGRVKDGDADGWVREWTATAEQLELWKRHRACWDKAVDLAPVPGERLQVPYEGTTLPGYFFRAPDAAPGERRPLVVMNNGSDGATSHMGLLGGWAANERGYHWMTVDGPGQQASLFVHGLPFRHDWEAVLTRWSTPWPPGPTSTPTGSP